MPRTPAGTAFKLTGGSLCLDFTNTVGDRPRCSEERLFRYTDILDFARQAGELEAREMRRLRRAADEKPKAARGAFESAIELRENVYRLFSAVARGARPETADLVGLNRFLEGALQRLRITRVSSGFTWSWASGDKDLERVMWPIAYSAAELITSAEREIVRECASNDCSWLFVDRSRTRRRRWCDMKTCGNRNKARLFYSRWKAARKRS